MTRWRCRCQCGGEVVVNRANLTARRTKSCGCLRSENMRLLGRTKHPKGREGMHNLQGRRFGRLKVVSRADGSNPHGQVRWNCVCDCGETRIIAGRTLLSGQQKSCGCARVEWARKMGQGRY